VEAILLAYHNPVQIPIGFIECLRDEPDANEHFHNFLEADQKNKTIGSMDKKRR